MRLGSALYAPKRSEVRGHCQAWEPVVQKVSGSRAWKTRQLVMFLLSLQSDIYFTAAATVHEGSSAGSSKGASAHTSPQTPPARDTLLFPSSPGEGEVQLLLPY